jgi:hypothetical protein
MKHINLRLPDDVYERLRDTADMNRRSINALIIVTLDRELPRATSPDIWKDEDGIPHVRRRIPGDPRPDMSTCRWCTWNIRRYPGSVEWVNEKDGTVACQAEPPSDAPVGHMPGGFISHPVNPDEAQGGQP